MKQRSTVTAFAVLLVCATAAAQEYGQWSWEAIARAGHRSYRNTLNGRSTNDYRQRDLQVFFGVNGFIVHPAIASFSAAVDTSANRYPSGSAVDSKQVGFRLSLAALGQSFFPIQIYASRQNYDYQLRPDIEGVSPYNIPDRATSFGGRLRLRGGPLRGLEASSDHTTIDVLGSASGSEVWNRDALDWSRGSRFSQQHYRLERQVRSFALGNYVLDDVLARAEEQGTAGRWHWNAFGNLLRREFSTQGASSPAITIGRVTGLLTNEDHDRPAWSLVAESGYAGGAANALSTHRVEGHYAHPRIHGVQWSPTASYMVQNAEDLRTQAPSAGLSANWIRSTGAFDLSASSGAALMRISSSGASATIPAQTRLSYSGGMTVGHSVSRYLTERLDVAAARDQLRTSSAVGNEPGLGTVGSAGTENSRQARLALGARAAAITANIYSDWTTRQSSLALPGKRFSTTTLMHTLQVTSRRVSATAMSGDTDVTANVNEKIHFLSAGLSLAPLSFLSITTTYRKDRRMALFEPRIDGERFEAGGSFRIGAIYMNVLSFWMTERLDGGDERKNRGLTMSVSRYFGGFLPIVSAPKRRGTIR